MSRARTPRHRALGAALGLVALGLGGCDEGEKRPPPTRERRDAVVVTGATTATRAPTASVTTAASKPRKICESTPAGVKPPKGTVAIARAADGGELANPIPFGAGKWIWLNLWAAWCKPCIAEMPHLRDWQQKLRQQGVLVDLAFVSLDDDGRQLQRFLTEQPAGGLRASYWLKEDARAGWLEPLGIKADAELPVHVLVSPRGQVSCIIHGAVEPDDFPKLAALLRAES